ncbi:hypothetical protein IWQ56_002747 [Coemansia nantahalensis]|nr:hypothetical protein IWQ56_002747 [Coemansia nantahalensis]
MKFAPFALVLTATVAVARPVPDGLLGGVVDTLAPITTGLGEVLNRLLGFSNGAGSSDDYPGSGTVHPAPGDYDIAVPHGTYSAAQGAPQPIGPQQDAGHPPENYPHVVVSHDVPPAHEAHVIVSHEAPPAHQAIVFKAVY